MTTYLAGDVRAIQEYVFGSPRLLEMRGASALLDAFDRGAVPHLVGEAGGDVAFAGGGNFLARWEGGAEAAQRASEAEATIRNAFLELTGSEGLTVVQLDTELPFEAVQAQIARKLAAAKREPSGARQLVSMPFLKRCESCGREAADNDGVPGAEPERRRWVGPICERKRHMLAKLQRVAKAAVAAGEGSPPPELRVPLWGKRIVVPPFSDRLLRQATPKDFQELSDGDDLAVVVADGNGLGEWFEEVNGWEEYRDLSNRVHDGLRSALEGSLDALFPGAGLLRIQVLIAGGDDLVAALPARYGLRFAQELVERFRIEHRGEARGMAAGVLLAGPSFPFRQAHALAEELLGRAKARCRADRKLELPGALDYHRVKGTHVQSLRDELALLRRQGPAGRAWSYGGSGPFRPEELEALLELAARLRTQTSAAQRGVLREILSPRDDGPHTPIDEERGVPTRVLEELKAWLARQETEAKPFNLSPESLERLISTVREDLGAGPVDIARFRLADALLLADLGARRRA